MRLQKTLLVLAAVALGAGCGRAAKPGSTLSVSARGTPNGNMAGGALQVAPGLAVDRVRVVVKDVALEPAEEAPGTEMPPATMHDGVAVADQGGDDDSPEGEVRVGPFLVDLSGADLAGAVTTSFDGEIPPGTYDELRLAVAPVPAADAAGNTGLLDMAGLEASVAIDGTAGTGELAKPFSVALPLRALVKREGTFQVGPGTSNVTVAVDPVKWFDGVTDPTTADGQAKLAQNILASLGVYLDDDEDGQPDE